MKKKARPLQLVLTLLLILVFAYTAFFGVSARYGDVTRTYLKGAQDIRFGVDIQGGVNVVFVPSDGFDATEEQLDAAQLVIENRLVAMNLTDYELYKDVDADRLILEFPWQSGETNFDPEAAIEEIGTTAYLTFREGDTADGPLVLDGSMVESASAQYGPVSTSTAEYYVALSFTEEGAAAFAEATTKLYQEHGNISIWLDDQNVSTATVNAAITEGKAFCSERGQLFYGQPHFGRKQPGRHGAGRMHRLWPHLLLYDSSVPSARIFGQHCPAGTGGSNLGLCVGLLPGF